MPDTFSKDIIEIQEAEQEGRVWRDSWNCTGAFVNSPHLESFVAKWLRPSELATGNACFCGKAVAAQKEIAAIEQGPIDDCWFLGALSTVVSHFGMESLIRRENSVGIGAYIFRFFKDGKEVHVAVDDSLPCSSDGLPAFARCKDASALWAPLAEKAYAKLHMSYASLSRGAEADALADLTGGPAWLAELRAAGESAPPVLRELMSHLQQGGLAGLSLFRHLGKDRRTTEAGQNSCGNKEQEPEFKVNIPLQEGAPPAVLYFGREENSAVIASRFISEHGLPSGAKDQIERFIVMQRSSPQRPSAVAMATDCVHPNHSYTILAADSYEGVQDALLLGNPWGVDSLSTESSGIEPCRQSNTPGNVKGVWQGQSAGGRPELPTWTYNPQFILNLKGCVRCELVFQLRYENEPRLQGKCNNFAPIGLDMFHCDDSNRKHPLGSNKELLVAGWSSYSASRQICARVSVDDGDQSVIVIPSQFESRKEARFVLDVYAVKGDLVQLALPTARGQTAKMDAESIDQRHTICAEASIRELSREIDSKIQECL